MGPGLWKSREDTGARSEWGPAQPSPAQMVQGHQPQSRGWTAEGQGQSWETRVEAITQCRGASWTRRAGGKWQVLRVWGRELFQSPVAAISNSHKLSGFKRHRLIISQF